MGGFLLTNHMRRVAVWSSLFMRKYMLTTEEIIRRARFVHGDRYDYSLVESTYSTKDRRLCIICPIHGEFNQKIDDHIGHKSNCPSCAKLIRAETNIKLYGCANVSQNVNIKQLKKQTCALHWGVDNPSHSSVIKAKLSVINKTIGLEKRKQTCLTRYGTESASSTESTKLKRKQTSNKNWGTDYPLQSTSCIEQSKSHKKPYTFPSGNTYMVQGYEPRALDLLISQGYDEIDLLLRNRPSFVYEWNGRQRRYHPDLVIPSEHRIIEVKSELIYNISPEQNLAKRDACIRDGWVFEFMIFK